MTYSISTPGIPRIALTPAVHTLTPTGLLRLNKLITTQTIHIKLLPVTPLSKNLHKKSVFFNTKPARKIQLPAAMIKSSIPLISKTASASMKDLPFTYFILCKRPAVHTVSDFYERTFLFRPAFFGTSAFCGASTFVCTSAFSDASAFFGSSAFFFFSGVLYRNSKAIIP